MWPNQVFANFLTNVEDTLKIQIAILLYIAKQAQYSASDGSFLLYQAWMERTFLTKQEWMKL